MALPLLLAVTLAWDANIDAVTGYKLHYGPTQGAPSQHEAVGNVTTATVDNAILPIGSTIYFTATASNGTLESGPSNEVAYVVPIPGPTATFVKLDTTTQGNWKGVYGANGQAIANNTFSFPAWAQVAFSGSKLTWSASSQNVRALQKPNPATDRIASTWYAPIVNTPVSVDVNITDWNSRTLAVYFLAWDQPSRVQKVDVMNAETGALLDTRTISGFKGGQWLVWTITGHVRIVATRVSGNNNPIISGLFL